MSWHLMPPQRARVASPWRRHYPASSVRRPHPAWPMAQRDVLGLAWNVAGVSFPVAYDFLALEDVNKDKIQIFSFSL